MQSRKVFQLLWLFALIKASTMRRVTRSTGSLLDCGKPSIAPDETTVVGAREAVQYSWPWMVSLVFTDSTFCTGAIVNENWIVTAISCVDTNTTASQWLVDAGCHSQDCEGESTGQRRNVTRIVRHPKYDSSNYDADLALVEVDSPFLFSAEVSPICLPDLSSPVSVTSTCFTTAWNITREPRSNYKVQQAMLPFVPHSICSDSEHYGKDYTVTDNMLCAGYQQNGTGVCQGEPGSLLACKSGSVWQLQGVSSWGDNCANPLVVFTRLEMFTSWIKETI